MYTKQEASKQRQAFWTAFGQYMLPIMSAEGTKVNWVNYKTGIAGIQFKMDVDGTGATIAIVLSHPDDDVQAAHYAQILQLKTMLQQTLGEDWIWEPLMTDENGKTIRRIGTAIQGVSIYRNEDWSTLISFFKPRIIALDAFWSDARYVFAT